MYKLIIKYLFSFHSNFACDTQSSGIVDRFPRSGWSVVWLLLLLMFFSFFVGLRHVRIVGRSKMNMSRILICAWALKITLIGKNRVMNDPKIMFLFCFDNLCLIHLWKKRRPFLLSRIVSSALFFAAFHFNYILQNVRWQFHLFFASLLLFLDPHCDSTTKCCLMLIIWKSD